MPGFIMPGFIPPDKVDPEQPACSKVTSAGSDIKDRVPAFKIRRRIELFYILFDNLHGYIISHRRLIVVNGINISNHIAL